MPGAEGQRRLDLDADAVEGNTGAVVRAVHNEAAGADRLQPGEAFGHPILRHDLLEAQRPCCGLSRCCRGQRPHGCGVGRRPEMDRHTPAVTADIHKTDRQIIGWKTLGKQIGNAPRRLFSGFQDGDQCRSAAGIRRSHCTI